MKNIVNDVIASLEEFRDEERIKLAARSYPTSMHVIGVIVPNEKKILNELKLQTNQFTGREKIELALELCKTNIFECQHIALEYLGKDKRALKELTEEDVDNLFMNMDNWVSVDCYSAYIVGYAWRENIITTEKVKSYYQSDDFWTRRISIVATISLNQKARGGKGDVERTLEICEMAIDDHTDMINKALSWALRELSKFKKEPVIEFMDKYEKRLHSRVSKEVWLKIETGKKN